MNIPRHSGRLAGGLGLALALVWLRGPRVAIVGRRRARGGRRRPQHLSPRGSAVRAHRHADPDRDPDPHAHSYGRPFDGPACAGRLLADDATLKTLIPRLSAG